MNRICLIPKDKNKISFLQNLMGANEIQLSVFDSLSELPEELDKCLILTEENNDSRQYDFLNISGFDESLLSQIELVFTVKNKLSPELKREFPSRKNVEKEYVVSCLKNLVHSANHRGGLGAFASYADLIQVLGKKENGYYIIGEDIVGDLISSADSARERLEKWEECIHILGNVHIQENLPVRQIKDCVSDIIRNLESLKKVKNHTIETIFDSAEKEISLNLKAFQILIREGLLNALKFSSPDSKIVLFGKAETDRFSILIINEIIRMEGGISGIPSEYEEYVFHPFFKLNNVYNEKFAVGEPGLGIGLFLIRHLTQEMSGSAGIKMLSSLASDNGKYLKRNTAALNISFPYIQA